MNTFHTTPTVLAQPLGLWMSSRGVDHPGGEHGQCPLFETILFLLTLASRCIDAPVVL
jgi:hypothetical protein